MSNTQSLERCFGQCLDRTCRVTKDGICEGYEKCGWYRAASEHRASTEASAERLRRLDGATQKYIADKYHRGGKPWMGTAERPKLEPLTMEEAAVLAFAVQSRIGRAPEDG